MRDREPWRQVSLTRLCCDFCTYLEKVSRFEVPLQHRNSISALRPHLGQREYQQVIENTLGHPIFQEHRLFESIPQRAIPRVAASEMASLDRGRMLRKPPAEDCHPPSTNPIETLSQG